MAGRQVVNEDLVNLPNWLLVRFRVRRADGPWGSWFTPDRHPAPDHRHTLDLRRATLTRTLRHQVARAGALAVEQTRLVHMADPHLAALRTVFTAADWSGEIEIESGLDGDVLNANVHRYRALERRQLTSVRTGSQQPGVIWMTCRTSTSGVQIAMAARTAVDGPSPADPVPLSARRRCLHRLVVPLTPGRPVAVEKTMALHTSRDTAISDPLDAAIDRVTAREPMIRAVASWPSRSSADAASSGITSPETFTSGSRSVARSAAKAMTCSAMSVSAGGSVPTDGWPPS